MSRGRAVPPERLSALDLRLVELVAQHVFGYETEVMNFTSGRAEVYRRSEEDGWSSTTQLPHWPTNIAAAWQVVEKMAELGWLIVVKWMPPGRPFWLDESRPLPRRCAVELTWIPTDTDEDARKRIFAHPVGIADSAPRAICLASLDALGISLPEAA